MSDLKTRTMIHFQALMEVVSHLKLDPIIVFHYEEEDVMVWKEFLQQETTAKVIPPIFERLPRPSNEEATR